MRLSSRLSMKWRSPQMESLLPCGFATIFNRLNKPIAICPALPFTVTHNGGFTSLHDDVRYDAVTFIYMTVTTDHDAAAIPGSVTSKRQQSSDCWSATFRRSVSSTQSPSDRLSVVQFSLSATVNLVHCQFAESTYAPKAYTFTVVLQCVRLWFSNPCNHSETCSTR